MGHRRVHPPATGRHSRDDHGQAIASIEPIWDLTVTNVLTVILANGLGLLGGFMLGVVIC